MTIITWPTALRPRACSLGLRKSTQQFSSPFNGTPQVVDFNAERWVLSVVFSVVSRRTTPVISGAEESFIFRLAGGVDWVSAWHFAREAPVGTARGTPTLSATANRGDASLAVTGATASGTYKAGDMLGAGAQLFMVRDDVTLNGSGAGTVNLVNRVRATIASASAVTWDKPTAYFATLANLASVAHVPGFMEGTTIDLLEVW